LPTTADHARAALGIRLRDIRRDAGLSAIQLATALNWQASKVSKIEHGKQTPTESDLRIWCEECSSVRQLPDLIASVRSIETQFAEWRRVLRSGIKRRQEESRAIYEKARSFRIYEPSVIPGLLQIREYAVAVLSTSIDFFQTPNDAEEAAQARIDRQEILSYRDRRFHVIMGEQALRTNVGGSQVMAAQLNHLLGMLRLPNVRLGVIPLSSPYRVPLHNGFWILGTSLVQFDTYTAEVSLSRPDEIALYSRAFERLGALAVYGAETREMISTSLTPHISSSKSKQVPGT
jgi:transcriptional regulator with XRE-family HTH domain